jgi:hypothetical protein
MEAGKIDNNVYLNLMLRLWKEIPMPSVAQDWRGVVIELPVMRL